MITKTFRVVACAENSEQYTTQNGTPSYKRQIRLQEFGGYNSNDNQQQRVSNAFVGTMFGNIAHSKFNPNDIVLASLRFSIREYQGQWYQDITVTDIAKM